MDAEFFKYFFLIDRAALPVMLYALNSLLL